MRAIYLVLLFAIISLTQISSQEDLISNAKKEYDKGNYNKSIESYDSLISIGYYSSDLYFNLGNSYYNKNEFGKAILYYEKALKYAPNNSDISHNIFLTKRKIDSEIIELPDFFLNRWWISLTNIFSLGTWTFLTLILVALLIITLGLRWFKGHKFNGYFPIIYLFIAIFFILSILASLRLKNTIYKSNYSVLIKSDTLYIAPDNRSELMYKLEPGEKLQLIDSIDYWYKIKLLNKETGWINKTNCEKI